MTVLELIQELDKLPPEVKCLPIYYSPSQFTHVPITRGMRWPELIGHENLVDRPERFVLE